MELEGRKEAMRDQDWALGLVETMAYPTQRLGQINSWLRSRQDGSWGHEWDWEGVGLNLRAAQACPLRASFDAQAAKPSTQLVVVRGRMNRSLLFFIVLGRLFNRSPFVPVRRSILLACRVLSSDAQQHSATAQA